MEGLLGAVLLTALAGLAEAGVPCLSMPQSVFRAHFENSDRGFRKVVGVP